ncbi:UNVERIFIED_CONTAM: hypothetical protein FKN15_040130 [Acipenser sinensis]
MIGVMWNLCSKRHYLITLALCFEDGHVSGFFGAKSKDILNRSFVLIGSTAWLELRLTDKGSHGVLQAPPKFSVFHRFTMFCSYISIIIIRNSDLEYITTVWV